MEGGCQELSCTHEQDHKFPCNFCPEVHTSYQHKAVSLGSALLRCVSGCANHTPSQRTVHQVTASREVCKPCILPISTQNIFPFHCPSSQSQKEIQLSLKSYVWDGYVWLQFRNQNLKRMLIEIPLHLLILRKLGSIVLLLTLLWSVK